MRTREALEGERKQVTVLFADLRGSLEILADRDPEDARRILDPVPDADDGGGAPLRRHGEPGDGRRHHGALRRAARPRGPRRARLLRGAADAGEHHHAGGGASQRARPLRADPRGAQLRRGRGALGRQRPAHGLHRRRARRRIWRRAWSSSRRRARSSCTEHTFRLTEGYVAAKSSGAVAVKGLAAPVTIYELTGPGPIRSRLQLAAAARAEPLRGTRSGAGRAGGGDEAGRRRARPGRGPRRRAGSGQVAARPGVHDRPAAVGLAGPRGVRDVLRHERRVPADDLPAARLLRHPGVGRRARDSRQGDGGAARPRPIAPGGPPRAADAARRAGRRSGLGRRSIRRQRRQPHDSTPSGGCSSARAAAALSAW